VRKEFGFPPVFRIRLTFLTAAAAAKINASIQAKKGIQHVDVPPIRSMMSPGGKSESPGASGNSAALVNGEMYIADGDYIRDIEVNDLRNRYTLTKGSTQKMVNTPCVNIPLIYQASFTLLRDSKLASNLAPLFIAFISLPDIYLTFILCGTFKLTSKRDSTHYILLIGIC
jgi:hypothetical protein